MSRLSKPFNLPPAKADKYLSDFTTIVARYLNLDFNERNYETVPGLKIQTSYKVLALADSGNGQKLYDAVANTIADFLRQTTLLKAKSPAEFRPLWALLDCWNDFLQSLWSIQRLLRGLQTCFIDKNLQLDSVDVLGKKIFTDEVVMRKGVIEKLDGFLRNPTKSDYRGRVYSQVPDMLELLNEAYGRRVSLDILSRESKYCIQDYE